MQAKHTAELYAVFVLSGFAECVVPDECKACSLSGFNLMLRPKPCLLPQCWSNLDSLCVLHVCYVQLESTCCYVLFAGLAWGVVERSASSPALSGRTLTDAGSGTTWTEAQSERTWSIPRSRTPLSGRPQDISPTLTPLSGNYSRTGHPLQLRLETALKSVQVLLVTHSFIHSYKLQKQNRTSM